MRPIRLNPPQSRAMRLIGPGLTLTLAFGRGVGKSWFIRRLAYLLIAQWEHRIRETPGGPIRGIRIVFLLPTFKQFRDVHSRALVNELRGDFAWLKPEKIDLTTFTVVFPGGSTIQVFPASEHGGQRARGIRADVALVDEADDTDAEVFDAVVGPWFTEPWSLKIRVLSGTPKRGRHGLLFKLFEAGRRGDRVRAGVVDGFTPDELEALARFYTVHATYRDAPGNVDQKEVDTARVTMLPATFEREYNCNFDAGEGLVYPFDDSFHVKEPPDLRLFNEFHVGGDHGWVDAGVLLLGGVRGYGQDSELWILDEWYESECPNNVWDARARAWHEEYEPAFWLDPSRPDRVADYRSQGCRVQDVDNEINGGVARVADLLFIRQHSERLPWARLYVSPKCTNTIREFGLYRRKKLGDGSFDEKPEDKNNHAMDALRYMAVGRFGKPQNFRHVVAGR